MPFFSWPSSLAYSSFPVFMPGGNGGAGIKGVSHNAQEGRFYPLRSAGLLVLLPVRFPGGGAVHFGVAGSAAVAAAGEAAVVSLAAAVLVAVVVVAGNGRSGLINL